MEGRARPAHAVDQDRVGCCGETARGASVIAALCRDALEKAQDALAAAAAQSCDAPDWLECECFACVAEKAKQAVTQALNEMMARGL